ncbi:prepilin-type N-terminal cleavage/methylation domain-containing protein [Krasilnikovia cinnamomea]|uniref:Prepilin-type N-terminal cleavage/methylation domain-containing protein n=1 Tax=Krasilnikovia cinnamomea TaxID=349313 RepID=A0A4Q7ZGI3_9ACTN|nr:prepilin-type N-terminal cleavage/methylation domain-containing protein [Krasilnikovia cinnamomea]RZU49149.1 prepilin-type N-terminal cleavage/methylation domain-containing protein [Krasilnikovia cinnamomea]
MRAAVRAWRRRNRRDDEGMTLLEVMLAMSILGVLMMIFTNAVLEVYHLVDRAENGAAVQSQLHLSVERLDQNVRYSSGITEPNTTPVGGAWYVEYLTINPTNSQQECHQLRLAPAPGAGSTGAVGVLQLLRWIPGHPPAAGSAGQTIASQIVLPGGNVPVPFERTMAGTRSQPSAPVGSAFTPDFMRLRLQLTASAGRATSTARMTFTALNTSRDTAADNVCREGRP